MELKRRSPGRRTGYGVLLLPKDGRRARKFELPGTVVTLLVALVVANIVLMASLFSVSVSQRIELAAQSSIIQALERSRTDLLTANSAQASRVHELVHEAEVLTERLRELEQLTDEVWALLGETPDPSDWADGGVLGQGGPDGDFFDPVTRMSLAFGSLSHQVPMQHRELEHLRDLVTARNHRLAHTPSVWPVAGYVSSEYGVRRHPISGTTQRHNGIDIAAMRGTPVYAPADGVVTFAGDRGGYGLTVIIDHGYGIQTLYAHSSRLHVRAGQRVQRGDLLTDVGTTGVSTGPHLHYEVIINGQPVNPRAYLP